MNKLTCCGWLLAGLGLLLSGCNKTDPGPALLVPLTGTVTVDGKPAAGVTLTFIPEATTKGTGGSAASDAEGKFTVMHRSGRPGIEPGSYRVVMSRLLTPAGTPVPTGESAMDHNAQESLPAKYTQDNEGTMRATVTEGMQPLAIEIKTK